MTDSDFAAASCPCRPAPLPAKLRDCLLLGAMRCAGDVAPTNFVGATSLSTTRRFVFHTAFGARNWLTGFTDTIRAARHRLWDFLLWLASPCCAAKPKDIGSVVSDQTALRCRRCEPWLLAATSIETVATSPRIRAESQSACVNLGVQLYDSLRTVNLLLVPALQIDRVRSAGGQVL